MLGYRNTEIAMGKGQYSFFFSQILDKEFGLMRATVGIMFCVGYYKWF
jgi:hypothetical protein